MVHGRTRDGRDVTLLEVGGANLQGPFSEAQESYGVELAVVGYHAEDDSFADAWAEFDLLDAWSDPPSIELNDGDMEAVHVRFEYVELGKAEIDGDTLRLVTGVQGTAGDSGVHLDRWCAFAFTFASPRPVRDVIESRVRPLHDLLAFTLGRSVRLTSLRLRAAVGDGQSELGDAFFDALQAKAGATPTPQSVRGYTAPTLLTRRDMSLGFDELLNRWFALWRELREAIVLLLGPYDAPFMYSEHRFASTFQSAETIHRARFPGRQLEQIDDIVRPVRGSGWQSSFPGDREVRRQLRLALSRNGLPATGELYDRAYAYIRENY